MNPRETLAADPVNLEADAISFLKFFDVLVLFGIIAMSALFFIFIILANTVWASSITKEKIIELTNEDRRDKGIAMLVENVKLSRAAMNKAEDMISKNYFSHTSPEGTTPWHWIEKEDYDYNYAGENLAMDFTSAEKMNQAWLASPTHRANILNEKYKEIGVAVREGTINGHMTILVVQLFGSGDKSSAELERTVEAKTVKRDKNQTEIPELPIGENNIKDERNSFANPMITSPQDGESVSGEEIKIFGRANPGAKARIFDKGELVGDSVADDEGWFFASVSGFEEGRHVLKVESEIFIGGRRETHASNSGVEFIVDSSKPEVEYQLSAGESGEEMVLRVFSNEPRCVFEVGKSRKLSLLGESVLFPVEENILSLAIKVRDQAGNKAFREVNLAGYHFKPRDDFDIVGKFANVFNSQKVFSAESGLMAMRKNLGLLRNE